MDFKKNSVWLVVLLSLLFTQSCLGYENRPGPLVLGTRTVPHSSALFQMNATDKGLLFPRMTTAQRNAIATPASGLVIYNTDSNDLQFYNGTVWGLLGGVSGFTQGSVNFADALGEISEDNANFFWDDTNNFLGIRDNTPSFPLDVNGDVRFTGNINSNIAAQRAVITDASGILTASSTTSTELSYVNGVTSAIQTQLNGKEPTIATGTATQYWRGDKVFSTINSDHLSEGVTNLFFTDTRARTAAVTDAIVDAVTNIAPSQNAVFDALALKANATDLANYVLKAGDTMSGGLRTNSTLTVDLDATVKGNLYLTSDPTAGALLSGANNKSVTINGGSAVGTDNGAQIQPYGITGAAPGDLILSAGSGAGEIIFRAEGKQYGQIDQNGVWSIGESGGTETHIVDGSLTGSGSGNFANVISRGNLIGSGSGQFVGQLSVGGNIIGSGSGQFSGKVAILSQNVLELQDSAGGENVNIKANATTTTYPIVMPASQGSSGHTLINDGSGNLTWNFPSATPAFSLYSTAVDYTITDGDGYSVISVTDSDPAKTITLPTVADNTNRCITIINNSTEQAVAARVIVDGEGAETISGDASVSLRWYGRQTTVCSTGTAWVEKDTNRMQPVSVRIQQVGTHSIISCNTDPCWISSTITDIDTGRSQVDLFGGFTVAPHCRCATSIATSAVCARGTTTTSSFSIFVYNTSFVQTDSTDVAIDCYEAY